MAPEYLTALASIGTFVVIAVTAIAAIIQLRHIRASNQLSGVLQYIKMWESDAMQNANRFIEQELPAKLRDPDYRRGLFARNPDRRKHLELVAADWCEQAGSYIKYGLIAEEQFLDLAAGYVASMWDALKEVVAIRRVAAGAAHYENFEYLAALERRARTRRGERNYPATVARLLPDEEWQSLAGPRPPD